MTVHGIVSPAVQPTPNISGLRVSGRLETQFAKLNQFMAVAMPRDPKTFKTLKTFKKTI